MSNFVLVLDTNKKPLTPIHPGDARFLLNQQKAAVFRRFPFTIILKESKSDVPTQPIELKIDPGSKTTGFALVQNNKVIWGMELQHRGLAIKERFIVVTDIATFDYGKLQFYEIKCTRLLSVDG